MSGSHVTVEISSPRFARTAARCARVLRRALPRLTKRPAAVEVFLLTDVEMRRVNREVRGKDVPTNVLSFEERGGMLHPELPRGVAARGEIYLAPDFIARRGESVDALAIHGLLHLFGYTHKGARDRITMERKEHALLHVVSHHRA